MTDAPVNVKLETPNNIPPDWETQVKAWRELNLAIGGNQNFYPLTIKGAHVIGIIYSLCQSVDILLKEKGNIEVTYLPAYGVFASGVELLGRVINGNDEAWKITKDIETGFKWLASAPSKNLSEYTTIPLDRILVTTTNSPYSIDELIALRNFAAHGQAILKQTRETAFNSNIVDQEILAHMPPLLAKGLEKYWMGLINDTALCDSLAKANVLPFHASHILRSWKLFEADRYGRYHSVEEIFSEFKWKA